MSFYGGPNIDSVATSYEAAISMFFIVATLFVAIRLFSKTKLTDAGLGWDDLVIILAWAFDAAAAGVLGYSVRIIVHLKPENLSNALLYSLVSASLTIMAIGISKLSIALLLVQLLRPQKWMATILYGTATLSIALATTAVLVEFLQCSPVQAQWNPTEFASASCLSPLILEGLGFGIGAFDTLVDLFYATYPIIVLRRLKIPMKRKIGISILMGLGYFSVGCAAYHASLFKYLSTRGESEQDWLYRTTEITLWGHLEANVVIVAACGPLLPPFVRSIKKVVQRYYRRLLRKPAKSDKSSKFSDSRTDRLSGTRTASTQTQRIYGQQGSDSDLSLAEMARIPPVQVASPIFSPVQRSPHTWYQP